MKEMRGCCCKPLEIFKYIVFVVLALFSACRVDSFLYRSRSSEGHGFHSVSRLSSSLPSKTALSAVTPAVDPAARFHSDMRRVLESRRNLSSANKLDLEPLERKKRPEVLTADIDGAERVLSMLRHMVSIGVATAETYQIALEALSRRGRLRWRRDDSLIVCAADEVKVIMHGLWGVVNDGEMSSESCNLALQAYAVCATPRGNRHYANDAQELLDKMIENEVQITAKSLSHVIHAWSWQQENMDSGECAQMAQENFDRLLAYSPDVETLQKSYHYLLEAWSKTSDEFSKEKAGSILNEMIAIREKHPLSEFPNPNSFTNAILAFSKNRDEESAMKAQELLEKTIQCFEQGEFSGNMRPDLIAFNGVLSAWARLGRHDKAEAVLSKLVRLSETYPELAPDVVSYNNILNANLQGSDRSSALDRILSIVDLMERTGDKYPAVKPDSFTYSMVMKAWLQSRRQGFVSLAMEALLKMHELWAKGDTAADPSNRYYNIVINALAKSRGHIDPQQAYDLLQEMKSNSFCKPDIITYTSVIECYCKSKNLNAFDVGVALLREAQDIHKKSKQATLMPNMRTYSTVISAANTNPTLQNVLKARELLVEMLGLYDETRHPDLEPNAFPFNYALNCAANCVGIDRDKIEAFQAAAQTYNDLRKRRKDLKADSYTYGFWFKCCNNLLPEGEIRSKALRLSFEQCKVDGMLSGETLRRLLAGTPPRDAKALLDLPPDTSQSEYRQIKIDDLPPDWSRNVR